MDLYRIEVKTDGNWEAPWDMSSSESISSLVIALAESMEGIQDKLDYRIVSNVNDKVIFSETIKI